MITQLMEVFGSRSKALEALYVMKGSKPVLRHGFYPAEIDKIEDFCNKNRLFMVKSPYKVILEEKEKFSNKGKIVKTDDKNGMFLVYISKDHFKALWACLYETRQDHLNTGIMLGYPKCCAQFFIEQFEKGNLNPEHKPENAWTNIRFRDEDVVLLSHFPCKSSCEKSIATARDNFEIIRKHDKTLAERYLQKLSEVY